jgi:hypothetical protein
MYVYSEYHKQFVLDPHLLSIIPFKRVWEKDKTKDKRHATAKILYLYHCFHPKSDFFEKQKSVRPTLVVQATMAKELHEECLRWEPFASEKEASFMDEDMWGALRYYVDEYLKLDPLWDSVEAFNEAIYNLNNILKDKNASPQSIRIASNELDDLPKKREKMRQQAEARQAFTLKVAGDKKIRRSERLPSDSKRQGSKAADEG